MKCGENILKMLTFIIFLTTNLAVHYFLLKEYSIDQSICDLYINQLATTDHKTVSCTLKTSLLILQ